MNTEELIKSYGFEKKENEYVKDDWTLRLDGIYFELFNSPEQGGRYKYACADDLEKYLKLMV